MNFCRKKKRGQDRRVIKTWFDETGHYRITWRKEAFGVRLQAAYHACVRCTRQDGSKYWDFCGRRGVYRVLNAAIQAAEHHKKLWEKAIEISAGDRKGRADKLREVELRARVGGRYSGHRLFSAMPVWVQAVGNSVLMAAFFPRLKPRLDDEDEVECGSSPNPSDLTSPSPTSEAKSSSTTAVPSTSSPTTPADGPVSNAEASVPSTTPTTRRARSKATKTATESSAPSAKGRGAGRAKSAKPRTAKPSAATRKKPPATKRSRKQSVPA